MTCLQLPKRAQQTQDANPVVSLIPPPHLPPPLATPKPQSSPGHPIPPFSPVPVLSYIGSREHHGLSTGLRAKPSNHNLSPQAAFHQFGSTWGNPRYHAPVYMSPVPSASPCQDRWAPHPCPHPPPCGESSTFILNKGSKREPSLPVWLDCGTTSPSL